MGTGHNGVYEAQAAVFADWLAARAIEIDSRRCTKEWPDGPASVGKRRTVKVHANRAPRCDSACTTAILG